MRKLLVVGGVALIAGVVWLFVQLNATVAAPAAAKTAVAERVRAADRSFEQAVTKVAAARAAEGSDKYSPASDAFVANFIEQTPTVVSGRAMRTCYHGGLSRQDRDASITFDYTSRIKDGEVTFTNVKITKSTLTDKSLESCFVREIGAAHWHDDKLPDYVMEDSVTMTPERIVKKYIPDDHEGPEAPANTPR
jgi:hypothetical protein